jgi:hypothetical protein
MINQDGVISTIMYSLHGFQIRRSRRQFLHVFLQSYGQVLLEFYFTSIFSLDYETEKKAYKKCVKSECYKYLSNNKIYYIILIYINEYYPPPWKEILESQFKESSKQKWY